IIDTAISPMSQGTSQPATEATVVALRGTPYDTGLSLRLLGEIAEHFRTVRAKYADFDSPVSSQIHADIMESQIPGGMFSNLVSQLRQQKAEDKLEAVLDEVQAVRKDLGYPPLVTPTSQIVGSQATVNVMTGKRYSVITMETRNYVMGLYGEPPGPMGLYGEPPGPISEEVKKKVLGKKEPITCRPADLLKPGLEQARKEIGSVARSEEDVLSYALFPEIAKEFFLWRESQKDRQQTVGSRQ
ncbi:MAG: pyruvate carboxylase subunit B, partial [Deltaproteobacteria bacterium]|nr:pyruvate carboxylase subunit B [Deltaproteobacteria bacterium]